MRGFRMGVLELSELLRQIYFEGYFEYTLPIPENKLRCLLKVDFHFFYLLFISRNI